MLKKIAAWTAVVFWMTVIYQLSAQTAEESSELSSGIGRYLYLSINKIAPGAEISLQSFGSLLRQGAHFFVFFILPVLLMTAFRVSEFTYLQSLTNTLLIGLIYAVFDELHQTFVPGRTAQIKDILTDGLGIITALSIYSLLKFITVQNNIFNW